jgi:hypothetical protein
MLIQKFARPDSIVAARMHPADFCNNICHKPTMARPFRSQRDQLRAKHENRPGVCYPEHLLIR